ncbi:hypothetical protein C5C13_15200 [Clavibacter michiganensis]|nr:hypothetical protein C5C13_15200 [Clavibacter michiganensis]
MTARHRLLFVVTLVLTSGLVIAGLIVFATSGLDDVRGWSLCIAATGIGMAYVLGRQIRGRPRR